MTDKHDLPSLSARTDSDAARAISRREAEEAVRTLLLWAGDDPDREGLVGTPDRVVRAYEEFFGGYQEEPHTFLRSASYDAAGYTDMVLLKNIRFESHCEHHISPILGVIHLAYLPGERVVGISKLARVCDAYARRLQIQEAMTFQIADALQDALAPRGVAVLVEGTHQCMTTRGVYKPGLSMVTRHFTGVFETDANLRREFLELIKL
jgi:GTP cyclohydrolase IA